MLMKTERILLLAVMSLALACSDDAPFANERCPTPGDPPSIEEQICEIFPDGGSQDEALRRLADVRATSQDPPARLEKVLRLVEFIRGEEDSLLDPDGQGPRTRVQAEADVIEAVVGLANIGMDVTAAALTDGIVAVVFPEGGTFIAKDECFGLEFPPEWGGPAFLLGTPLAKTADPLDNSLGQFVAQFPVYADFQLSAEPQKPLQVGLFTITDEIDPSRIPALRVAHNVPEGGVEIGSPVEPPFALPCPPGAAPPSPGLRPAGRGPNGIALATGRKSGTTVNSLSPFGTVDPGD
jgi:hypothetical protein